MIVQLKYIERHATSMSSGFIICPIWGLLRVSSCWVKTSNWDDNGDMATKIVLSLCPFSSIFPTKRYATFGEANATMQIENFECEEDWHITTLSWKILWLLTAMWKMIGVPRLLRGLVQYTQGLVSAAIYQSYQKRVVFWVGWACYRWGVFCTALQALETVTSF